MVETGVACAEHEHGNDVADDFAQEGVMKHGRLTVDLGACYQHRRQMYQRLVCDVHEDLLLAHKAYSQL
eukprot:10681706-Karenia_brevis.AAC.1